jgi:hypothetical protein
VNVVALLAAVARLVAALTKTVSNWKLLSAGQAQGRAEAERDHALAAKQAEDEMRALAENSAGRDEVLKRLDEGSA